MAATIKNSKRLTRRIKFLPTKKSARSMIVSDVFLTVMADFPPEAMATHLAEDFPPRADHPRDGIFAIFPMVLNLALITFPIFLTRFLKALALKRGVHISAVQILNSISRLRLKKHLTE